MELIFSFFVMFLFGFIDANQDKQTRCYGSYCYTMLKDGVQHSSNITKCASKSQKIQTLNEQGLSDLFRFTKEIDVISEYVALQMNCSNVAACFWVECKHRRGFVNTIDALNTSEVPNCERLTKVDKNDQFSVICTSDAEALLAADKSEVCNWKRFKLEILVFVAASGTLHLITLVTISVLITSRKKKRQILVSKDPSNDSSKREQDLEKLTQEISCRSKLSPKRDKGEIKNVYQTLHSESEGDDHNYANLKGIKTI